MTDQPGTDSTATAGAALSPGAVLREAREAAGLSIDAVAQQLKLAPRQVQALEADDHESLPGRTFVRGFLRNYARLVRLDPDALVGLLPSVAPTPALAPTPAGMGEIHVGSRRETWSRWAIPFALVVLVAIAALYEYLRPGEGRSRGQPAAQSTPSAPAAAPAPSPTVPEGGGQPLPNPLAPGGEPRSAADAAALPVNIPAADTANAGGTGATLPAPPAAPGGATSTPVASPTSLAPAAAPSPTAAAASPAPIVAAAPGAPAGTLVIDFRGPSWAEVRDRNGRVVLSVTGTPGTSQTVKAEPPLEVVVGNAAGVAMTWQGAAVDVAGQQRQNVARLKLD